METDVKEKRKEAIKQTRKTNLSTPVREIPTRSTGKSEQPSPDQVSKRDKVNEPSDTEAMALPTGSLADKSSDVQQLDSVERPSKKPKLAIHSGAQAISATTDGTSLANCDDQTTQSINQSTTERSEKNQDVEKVSRKDIKKTPIEHETKAVEMVKISQANPGVDSAVIENLSEKVLIKKLGVDESEQDGGYDCDKLEPFPKTPLDSPKASTGPPDFGLSGCREANANVDGTVALPSSTPVRNKIDPVLKSDPTRQAEFIVESTTTPTAATQSLLPTNGVAESIRSSHDITSEYRTTNRPSSDEVLTAEADQSSDSNVYTATIAATVQNSAPELANAALSDTDNYPRQMPTVVLQHQKSFQQTQTEISSSSPEALDLVSPLAIKTACSDDEVSTPIISTSSGDKPVPVSSSDTPAQSKAIKKQVQMAVRRTSEPADQQKTVDEDLVYARKPLTDLYGAYVSGTTDTCLADARSRLKLALDQTRKLRQAFTERVYNKYRVCLRPAPETDQIIAEILADPVAVDRRLKTEMSSIREEKDIEKKEAVKLNTEMAQSKDSIPALATVDNAEQLMFFTAGLNLVILPEEEVDASQVCRYPERAPINAATGQRVRSISQAAAVAGEVILDRTRKSVAMRVERQRRQQLHFMAGAVGSVSDIDNNYSRLELLSSTATVPQTWTAATASGHPAELTETVAGLKKPSSSSLSKPDFKLTATTKYRSALPTGKIPRTRHPAQSLSMNMLTSLNPNNDEFRSSETKPSAATSWLKAHTIGTSSQKTTQQRTRHPFPGSCGGMVRNPNNSFTNVADEKPELLLPPRLTVRDRLDLQPTSVWSPQDVCTERARSSISCVVNSFGRGGQNDDRSVSTTKIGFLLGIQDEITSQHKIQSSFASGTNSASPNLHISHGRPRNSVPLGNDFTVSVLHAVGLIRTDRNPRKLTRSRPAVSHLLNEHLLKLKGTLEITKTSVTGINAGDSRQRTKTNHLVEGDRHPAQIPDEDANFPLASGGGGAEGLSDVKSASRANIPLTGTDNQTVEHKPKRQRSESSPFPTTNAGTSYVFQHYSLIPTATNKTATNAERVASVDALAVHPESFDMHCQNSSTFSTIQLANQPRASYTHHPTAGDLAEHVGGFQQQGGKQQHYLQKEAAMQFLSGNAAAFKPSIEPQPAAISEGPRKQVGLEIESKTDIGNLVQPETKQEEPTGNRTQQSNGGEDHVFNREDCVKLFNRDFYAKKEILSKELADSGRTLEANGSETHWNAGTPEQVKEGHPSLDPKCTASSSANHGAAMQCFFPAMPESLTKEQAALIRFGNFNQVIPILKDQNQLMAALDYLMAIGAAIPIPKAMILGPLKDRLNSQSFRYNSASGVPPIPRDVVVAAIVVWLWAKHENDFQRAYATNGRIDVDRHCKWLVFGAVHVSVRELFVEINESMAKGVGAFAEAAALRRGHSPSKDSTEANRSTISKRLELCTASVVSRAVAEEVFFDSNANLVLANFHDYVVSLDEARLAAFKSKAQERTLLAALLSRTTRIDEMFSQGFVSAMVRAGEAMGHGKLFEAVQNEAVLASTMIPYDIFTYEQGTWEDPAKPPDGYSAGITGEELMNRAHARAMVQMSLRKLQDRHQIRGGTPSYGPYVNVDDRRTTAGAGFVISDRNQPASYSPRPGFKRRLSSFSFAEPPVQPGTGSAQASSWSVYDPNHFSLPLEWETGSLQNTPYGVHSLGTRKRSLSISNSARSGETRDSKKAKRATIVSSPILGSVEKARSSYTWLPSTNEVCWADVASVFHLVKLPKKTPGKSSIRGDKHVDKTIYAPIYQQVPEDIPTDHEESDTEEDLTDETLLQRHQLVLDNMKKSLNAFIEERKKQQEQRKINRGSK